MQIPPVIFHDTLEMKIVWYSHLCRILFFLCPCSYKTYKIPLTALLISDFFLT